MNETAKCYYCGDVVDENGYCDSCYSYTNSVTGELSEVKPKGEINMTEETVTFICKRYSNNKCANSDCTLIANEGFTSIQCMKTKSGDIITITTQREDLK